MTAPEHTRTDCRTPEGVTVSLIDGLIATCRVLASRDFGGPAVAAALADLRSDEDVQLLVCTDLHGRPLGGGRERDGRLLAAARGVDLTAGACDNATRAYWYESADVARAKLDDWAEHPSDCLCRHGYDCPTGGAR